MNEITKENWKDFRGMARSLWSIARDSDTNQNKKDFHGVFVFQVAENLVLRYTKSYDWVLDMFGGSFTTARACAKHGRFSISGDVNIPEIMLTKRLRPELPKDIRVGRVETDDTLQYFTNMAAQHKYYPIGIRRKVALTILHPPYYDVIQFSEDSRDLSRLNPLAFITAMGFIFDNAFQCTHSKGHIALVIGDVYKNGEVLPGYEVADVFKQRYKDRIKLKAVFIKNIAGNEKAKGINTGLWEYRALKHGFSTFNHEYIYCWQKTGE